VNAPRFCPPTIGSDLENRQIGARFFADETANSHWFFAAAFRLLIKVQWFCAYSPDFRWSFTFDLLSRRWIPGDLFIWGSCRATCSCTSTGTIRPGKFAERRRPLSCVSFSADFNWAPAIHRPLWRSLPSPPLTFSNVVVEHEGKRANFNIPTRQWSP
jgi:hypothetical protein